MPTNINLIFHREKIEELSLGLSNTGKNRRQFINEYYATTAKPQ